MIASKDEQVKTNAGTVIEICLNINKKLDEQIREDEERVATDMLLEGEPLEKITRYSRLADDCFRDICVRGKYRDVRDIRATLQDLYHVDVSHSLISKVTDVVNEEVEQYFMHFGNVCNRIAERSDPEPN